MVGRKSCQTFQRRRFLVLVLVVCIILFVPTCFFVPTFVPSCGGVFVPLVSVFCAEFCSGHGRFLCRRFVFVVPTFFLSRFLPRLCSHLVEDEKNAWAQAGGACKGPQIETLLYMLLFGNGPGVKTSKTISLRIFKKCLPEIWNFAPPWGA